MARFVQFHDILYTMSPDILYTPGGWPIQAPQLGLSGAVPYSAERVASPSSLCLSGTVPNSKLET